MKKDKFGYYYPAYRYYVSNAFRWYFTHPDRPEGVRKAQMDNWLACEQALGQESDSIKIMLKELYTSKDSMGEAIFEASIRYDLPPDSLWTKVGQMERRFAYVRGLI